MDLVDDIFQAEKYLSELRAKRETAREIDSACIDAAIRAAEVDLGYLHALQDEAARHGSEHLTHVEGLRGRRT